MSADGSVISMVWEEPPPGSWPDGYDSVCVKACDGLQAGGGQHFGWADNAAEWMRKYPDRGIGVWAVAYPGDGGRLGELLAARVPHAKYVVLDIEDWPGITWRDADIQAIVEGVRAHLPGLLVAYSTYPTAGQCHDHGIDQPLLERLCDFAMPQVYYPYQRLDIDQVSRDHRHPHVIAAPVDDPQWEDTARWSLTHSAGVFLWRAGLTGWRGWPAQLHPAPVPPAPPSPVADPLRPSVHNGPWPGRFVAWDGETWWLTDMVWRRACTETMAAGLRAGGVPVVLWRHCAEETAEVHPG